MLIYCPISQKVPAWFLRDMILTCISEIKKKQNTYCNISFFVRYVKVCQQIIFMVYG